MRVQIALLEDFDLLDVVGPYEVFEAAAMLTGGAVEVSLVHVHGPGPIPSGPSGLTLAASQRPDLAACDVFVIPGVASSAGTDVIPAMLWERASGPWAEVWSGLSDHPDLLVTCVCGGAMVLGMAGALEGRHAVTHYLGMEALGATGAIPVPARVVEDGRFLSGGGVTSGIDVALRVLERVLGPQASHAVEALFEYERRGTVWRPEGLEVSP